MTTVTFHTEGSRIVSFEVQGHSGYAPEGEDIVCAAVTSAVRLAECAVNDVLGLEAAVKVRQKDAYLSLKLPAKPGSDRREHLSDADDRSAWSTSPSCMRSTPITLSSWRCKTC